MLIGNLCGGVMKESRLALAGEELITHHLGGEAVLASYEEVMAFRKWESRYRNPGLLRRLWWELVGWPVWDERARVCPVEFPLGARLAIWQHETRYTVVVVNRPTESYVFRYDTGEAFMLSELRSGIRFTVIKVS
ncbi:MAG: hypothetical protein JNN11_03220 [Candidatus Doudnabacteria bacterium]|nr:hypothetical protein [Candidatus Doudnabacteria bacterium]